MKRINTAKGFTLVELLIAMTLMVMILSMVYGSYVAVADTSRQVTDRVGTVQTGQIVLLQVQSLLHGCFTPEVAAPGSHTAGPPAHPTSATVGPRYFHGNDGGAGGTTLRFVTSRPMKSRRGPGSQDLFATSLVYDRLKRSLSIRQGPLAPQTGAHRRPLEDYLLSSQVEAFTLSYYDGKRWRRRWNYQARKSLPQAIRVQLTLLGKQSKPHHCGTVVHLPCARQRPAADASGERP